MQIAVVDRPKKALIVIILMLMIFIIRAQSYFTNKNRLSKELQRTFDKKNTVLDAKQ